MGIKQNKIDLASFIVDDFKDFDPAHPDSLAALNLGGLFTSAGGRRMVPGSTPAANSPPSAWNPGPGPL
jgi:hypothetical protein